ncbi:MAG: PP2C family protein-serine/threonine phosphatase [Bryobacteraceae bacterium]
MHYLVANAQHIGTRQNQQDAFGCSDLHDANLRSHGGVLAIVADGMGGLAHGDLASKLAVKVFLEAYRSKAPSEMITESLERSVYAANEAVWMMAAQAGVAGDVGTTLVAAAFFESALYWASVGDSALFLLRDGRLSQLTTSHVYAHDLDARQARGEITAEQALGDPQREALTSYVGKRELRLVDRNLHPFTLQVGDRVLLATDGLFKTVPEQEIAEVMSGEGERAAEALVERTLARQREHQDNVTALTVTLASEAPKAIKLGSPATERYPSRRRFPLIAAAAVLLVLAVAGAWLLWRGNFLGAQSGAGAGQSETGYTVPVPGRTGAVAPNSSPPVEKGKQDPKGPVVENPPVRR